MVGIYLITSPSNKKYIGQTTNFKKRINDYRNLPENRQPTVFNSFKKYGFDSHEIKIIHELPVDVSQDVLNVYEQYYLDTYREAGFKMMNIREAGSKGKLHQTSKDKIGAANKGRLVGVKQTPEHIKSRLEVRMKGNIIWKGKKHKTETIEKMRLAKLGKPKSEAHAKKNRENFAKATSMNLRAINQFDINGIFIKYWPSIKSAADTLGFHKQSITHACGGKYKTAHGFKWKYVN